RIEARFHTGGQPVVDMPPIGGRSVCRVDAERLDRIDELEHTLDLRPAVELEQEIAAGSDKWRSLERLAASDGAQDVDTRHDGPMFVRRPADEGEDAVRREADDAAAPVDRPLVDRPT